MKYILLAIYPYRITTSSGSYIYNSIFEKRMLTNSFSPWNISFSCITFWKMNSITYFFRLGEMFWIKRFSSFWFSCDCCVYCKKPTTLLYILAGIFMFCIAVFTWSSFFWKASVFLFRSWIKTAMLPKIFALMMAPTVFERTTKKTCKSPTGNMSLPIMSNTEW